MKRRRKEEEERIGSLTTGSREAATPGWGGGVGGAGPSKESNAAQRAMLVAW